MCCEDEDPGRKSARAGGLRVCPKVTATLKCLGGRLPGTLPPATWPSLGKEWAPRTAFPSPKVFPHFQQKKKCFAHVVRGAECFQNIFKTEPPEGPTGEPCPARVRERVPKVEWVPGVSEGLPREPENRLSTQFPGAPAQAPPGGSQAGGAAGGREGASDSTQAHTVWGRGMLREGPRQGGRTGRPAQPGPPGYEGESVNGHGPANCTLTAHGGAAMRMRS